MSPRCIACGGQLTKDTEGLGLEEEVDRRSGSYIRWVQRSLNRLIAAGLSEDGISGRLTRSAISRFQKQTGLGVDGIVGPNTEEALIRAGAGTPPGYSSKSSKRSSRRTPRNRSMRSSDRSSRRSPRVSTSRSSGRSAADTFAVPSVAGTASAGRGDDLENVRTAAVRIANEEYARWRPGGNQLTETSAAARPYLERYWTEGVGMGASSAADAIAKQTAWSAAFISWVLRSAGAGPDFRYSACHATYIKAAKDNRLAGNSNPFKAYRVTEVAPRVGDLVCKCRGTCQANYDTVDPGTSCMPTHCDVVVEIRSGSIRTIGGNLSDSVGSTVVQTDSQGRIAQSGYFAVLRVGDEDAGGSGVSPSSAPPASVGVSGPRSVAGIRGANAFGQLFAANGSGRQDANAYLLAYLSTMIYPDRGLSLAVPELAAMYGASQKQLEHMLHSDDDFFKSTFADFVTPFLYDAAAPESATNAKPRFVFRTAGQRSGSLARSGLLRDPEAMVIDTTSAVLVVFRGTDRVGTADEEKFGYKWGEWISTDFFALGVNPGSNMKGKVHGGIWKSLEIIKDQLAQDVIDIGGGSQKPVWVTGHSLGAAQAILFAVFLAARHGIHAQGTHAFASPRVGDREFRDYVKGFMEPSSIQRFDFVADPVTMVAPRLNEIPSWVLAAGPCIALRYAPVATATAAALAPVVGPAAASIVSALAYLKAKSQIPEYYHAGIRNYFDDVNTFRFNTAERSPDEFSGVLKGLFPFCADPLANLTSSPFNSFCFHHPQWYLVGAYRQLPDDVRQRVPIPVALPTKGSEACGTAEIARGVAR